MDAVKGLLFLGGALLLIIGIAAWRLDFSLPFYSSGYYVIAGLILVIATYFGRILAPYIFMAGFVLLMVAFFDLAGDFSGALTYGLLCIVAGILLYFIGSEEVEAASKRIVVCAACNQYLGTPGGLIRACPRCGSNRYRIED